MTKPKTAMRYGRKDRERYFKKYLKQKAENRDYYMRVKNMKSLKIEGIIKCH